MIEDDSSKGESDGVAPDGGSPPVEDVYGVVEPEPTAATPEVTSPQWYVAGSGGQKEGPLSLLEMQQRVASGRIGRQSLVWRTGMPDWLPAGSVAELFGSADRQSPPPVPPSSAAAAAASAKAVELLRQADRWFCLPRVYRTVGRLCAVLAALLLLLVLILLSFGPPGSALNAIHIVVLASGVFLLGEAAGAILEGLQRIEQRVAPPETAADASETEQP